MRQGIRWQENAGCVLPSACSASWKTYDSVPDGNGLRIAIVACRDNRSVVEHIVRNAQERLRKHGVADGDMTTIVSPSAFALLPLVKWAIAAPEYDAVLAIAAIVGDAGTTVDAPVVGNGLNHLLRFSNKPVGMGVLVADSPEEARSQLGTPEGTGETAAVSILELCNIHKQMGEAWRTSGNNENGSAHCHSPQTRLNSSTPP